MHLRAQTFPSWAWQSSSPDTRGDHVDCHRAPLVLIVTDPPAPLANFPKERFPALATAMGVITSAVAVAEAPAAWLFAAKMAALNASVVREMFFMFMAIVLSMSIIVTRVHEARQLGLSGQTHRPARECIRCIR